MGAKIYNSDLTQEIIDGAKLQQGTGQIPSEIAEKVIPVMEVNPKLLRRTKIANCVGLSNATSATNITFSSTKDTFLCGYSYSFIKDATSTATLLSANVIPYGRTTALSFLKITSITLTADSGTGYIEFNPPLRVARGTAITLTSDTNVANVKLTGVPIFYEVDNITA